jgi:hypothetical protein
MYHCLKHLENFHLSTKRNYVLFLIPTIKCYYFPKQHLQIRLHIGGGLYSQ